MKTLVEFIAQVSQQGQLPCSMVYAGCGRLQNVELLASLSKKIILFEADTKLKELNLDAITDFPHIQYLNKPLWIAAKTITYQQYNFPRFNSVKKVIDGNVRYPNLKCIAEVELPARTLDKLELHPDSDDFLLVLDLNGAEFELLSQIPEKIRPHISQLILALPEAGLYESADAGNELSVWAQANAWQLTQQLPAEEGGSFVSLKSILKPHPVFVAEDPALQQRLLKLEEINEQLQSENKTIKARVSELEEGEKQVKLSFDAERSSWKNASEEIDKSYKKQLAELEKKHEEALKKLTQKVTEIEAEKARLVADKEAKSLAMQDLEKRQRLMNEELVRGEAQLTLIKDMLLRDAGF